MTLIEITLVIAILLGLIAVLFIGISAYKQGADRAKCILQMATIQKLIISYGNLNALNIGDTATIAFLITDGYISAGPSCPAGGTYSATDVLPGSTDVFFPCDLTSTPENHVLTL